MVRRRYSRDQWLEWLVEQPQSGLSIVKFCVSKGIGEQSFYHWRQKLRKELKRAERRTSKRSSKSTSPFIPVEVVVPVHQVAVELPCGAVAKVPADERSVRLVFQVLLDLGGGS